MPSPVSVGTGDCLWTGKPSRHVNNAWSTQPSIPQG